MVLSTFPDQIVSRSSSERHFTMIPGSTSDDSWRIVEGLVQAEVMVDAETMVLVSLLSGRTSYSCSSDVNVNSLVILEIVKTLLASTLTVVLIGWMFSCVDSNATSANYWSAPEVSDDM